MTGDDDRDLERPEPGAGEMIHRAAGAGMGTRAAHGVVGRRVDAVEADLDVEVCHRCQTSRRGGVEVRAVGGELDTDAVGRGVPDDVEEVASDHRLAAADVDVEHLQRAEFVEEVDRLCRRQLERVAATR